MPAARDDESISPDDPDLEMTAPKRLQAFAELMAIGLQCLRERPHDAPDSGPAVVPSSAPFLAPPESSEFRTNELA